MKTGLWKCLETFTIPAAVLAEWRQGLGTDFEHARGFLDSAQRLVRSYPCTNLPSCGGRHEVREIEGTTEFTAVLEDELISCPPIRLQPCDLLVHELNTPKLCGAIRTACKFDVTAGGGMDRASRTHRVGNWGAAQSPVFLMFVRDEAGFLKELEGSFAIMPDPFILLTPTGSHYRATVEAAVRRHGCAHIPLSRHLALEGAGRLKVTKPVDGILADFERQRGERMKTGPMLAEIHRAITTVGEEYREIRTAKERLQQMRGEGLLKFLAKVDARSFKILCQILADGTVAEASRSLSMADSTLRAEVADLVRV